MKEGGHLEDGGVVKKILLKWIFGKCDGVMNWIYLAQDRHRWWAFVFCFCSVRGEFTDDVSETAVGPILIHD